MGLSGKYTYPYLTFPFHMTGNRLTGCFNLPTGNPCTSSAFIPNEPNARVFHVVHFLSSALFAAF
jgi:hypothetical protein